MKKVFYSFLSVAILAVACNEQDNHDSHHVSPSDSDKAVEVIKVNTPENEAASEYVSEVIGGYLSIKGALALDNSADATSAASVLVDAIENFDLETLNEEEAEVYTVFAENAQVITLKIHESDGDIKEQRDLFIGLSSSIENFIRNFGTGGRTLYKDYCPMVNNDTGAAWISEVVPIENPYFGSEMFACGLTEEQFEE